MATLRSAEKRWVVEQLACFDTPTEVEKAFPEAFPGRAITRMQAANFDASKPWARTRMAEGLVKLFDETRKRFREETDDIAIANKSWRLRQLERLYRDTKSPAMRKELLEQGAKESEGAYSNRRAVDVTSGGEPIGAVEVRIAHGPPPGSSRPAPPTDA